MSAIQSEYRYLIARAEKSGDHKRAEELRERAYLQDVDLTETETPLSGAVRGPDAILGPPAVILPLRSPRPLEGHVASETYRLPEWERKAMERS